MSLLSFYGRPIKNLSSLGERYKNIFSHGYSSDEVREYLTDQFISGAKVYSEKYTNYDQWHGFISRVVAMLSLESRVNDHFTILDIGSGSGNTILPLLVIFPNAKIIASDLSIELLALLNERYPEYRDRLDILQLNAEELDFQDESFDLVVGGAILHHLIDPEKTIAGAYRILKKNGHAFFFESFQSGFTVLQLIYTEILQEFERQERKKMDFFKVLKKEDPFFDVKNFLRILTDQYVVMKGKIDETADDKQLFTKTYFYGLAKKYNFSNLYIESIPYGSKFFERKTLENIHIGLGKGREALPQWAWKIINRYDGLAVGNVREDLLVDGSIVYTK